MKAMYTYAVVYQVSGRCETPLRSGGTDGDTEAVCRKKDGRAILQGSSLAGAMREFLTAEEGEKRADELFGSQDKAGSLMISDLEFSKEANMEIRPRLRLNKKTGAADDGGKFDVAHMGTGSDFTFTLTWLGEPASVEDTKTIEMLLSALHNGEIRLGAQKTNGFGRVSLKVKRSDFDMTKEKQRKNWLENKMNEKNAKEVIFCREKKRNDRVSFTVKGSTKNILVKGSAPEIREKQTVTVNIKENGKAVLPASSIKGAVRSRTEKIAAFLKLPETVTDDLFGRGNKTGDGEKDNGKAGHVLFSDMEIDENTVKMSRIRINRFTGGVILKGLFTEEPHSSRVELAISAPSEDRAGCGLLLYALRDLGLGLYNLGSGEAIGRGFVRVSEIKAEAPDGRKAKLLFGKNGECTAEDKDGLFEQWLEAVEEKGEKQV